MSNPLSADVLALQEVLAGRYSVERELGRGGMGTVLLARDVPLDRLVAIKVLPPALAADDVSRERFLREARTAAGFSHPHIVPIHAVEEHGSLVFFVMGFVDGETLRERVERRGPVTPRYAMKVMQEVAWALAYAHDHGVVHRDIKPDNIMIDRATDRAIVTDFGIAQSTSMGAVAATGEIIGTARYMSPEQASGDVVDARSDLYSLAATLFFALTGRAPFEASNLPAILSQQIAQPAPALQTLRPEAPARLAAIIDRCLRKGPADRVQTGEELATLVGEVRGRELRAPPLVRSFVRTAEVSTMVVLAAAMAGQLTVGGGDWNVSIGGPGLLGTILIVQLVRLARRLLREGYSFNDIRAALLSEAQIQAEEADVIGKARWLRRLDSMWHRLWASRFGRWFFRVSGMGIRPPAQPIIASADATEMVMGRAAVDLFEALPASDRTRAGDVPRVVHRLENRVERMRAEGRTGEAFTNTVAALENIRLALLRLQAGAGSIEDLTSHLERARQIGGEIDRHLEARREVEEGLAGPSGS